MYTYKQHLALLRNPSYCCFILNGLFAALGNGLSYVALTWLVIKVHSSVSAVAILMACFWMPMVLIGPLCGVISDRFHRLSIMVIATAIRAVLFIGLGLILKYHYSLLIIYIFSAVSGASFSLYNPAMFTFIRELVPAEKLLLANTQLDMVYEMGNVIGMGLAGFVMAVVSPSMTLVINGAFFVLVTLVLMFVKYKPQPKDSTELRKFTTILPDFKLGLDYILENKPLYVLYLIQLLVFVEYMTAPILLAPYAKTVLHATAGQFGQIEAAMSIGVVLGGIFNPSLAHRFGVYKVLLIETIGSGLSFILFSFTKHFQSAALLYFVLGLSLSSWPLIVTKAQEVTKLSYQGRVQSTFSSVSGILILFIYFSVQLLGDVVPIQKMYLIELIFAIAGSLLLWRYRLILYCGRT